MKLADAVNSGKKIKRPSKHDAFGWLSQRDDGCVFLDMDGSQRQLQLKDLIADDWMIEEKIVVITKTTFVESFQKVLNRMGGSVDILAFEKNLIRELGLDG